MLYLYRFLGVARWPAVHRRRLSWVEQAAIKTGVRYDLMLYKQFGLRQTINLESVVDCRWLLHQQLAFDQTIELHVGPLCFCYWTLQARSGLLAWQRQSEDSVARSLASYLLPPCTNACCLSEQRSPGILCKLTGPHFPTFAF
jgi:hypothetical protein